MPNLADKKECTGCTACVNTCPKQCLEIQTDEEGFRYPNLVRTEACIACGACERVCPVLSNKHRETEKYPIAYAAVSLDEMCRLQSSSGGIFTEIAKYVLAQGGVVYGAEYNEQFDVVHCCVQTVEDLQRIRGAKYAESDLGKSFADVRIRLNRGQMVLFSGTPCQVAGLKSFLKKDYTNLVCVDFICHGVPSPMAWKAYVKYRAKKDADGAKVTAINLRAKHTGWSRYRYSNLFQYENGKEHSATSSESLFMKLFVGDSISRPSCENCMFKGYSRVSDITLGDFWGIWDILPEMDDDKGTSVVLLQSEQGQKIWNEISGSVKAQEVSLDEASMQNQSLLQPSKANPNRAKVLKMIREGKLAECESLFLERKSFWKWMEKNLMLLISMFITLSNYFGCLCTQKLYTSVDNFTIALVTNGYYGEDTYTYYLHPWLCKGINLLSKALPNADAYTLLMHVLLFGAFWIIYYLILKKPLQMRDKVVSIILIFAVSFNIYIWQYNYTVQATFFVLSGYAILQSERAQRNIYMYIVAIVYMCIGYMWRLEGALLTVPFLLLDIGMYVWKRKSNKRLVLYWITATICIFGIMLSETFIDMQYAEFIEYSKQRTRVEDFPMVAYNELPIESINFSESEYDAACNWYLFDVDRIDTELLHSMADLGATNEFEYTMDGCVKVIKTMILSIVSWSDWTITVGSSIIFMFITLLKGKINWKNIAEAVMAFAGGAVIIVYFAFKGRALEHVWLSVIMSILCIYLLQMLRKLEKETVYYDWVRKVVLLVCVGGLIQCLSGVSWHEPVFPINSRKDNQIEEFEKTYSEDSLYIWGGWHREITFKYMNLGKLPTQEFIEHNMSVGDWIYGQKYYLEYLDRVNAANPAIALLERENTYFVSEAETCSFVLEYMREHYGEDIQVVQVDSILYIPVWKFVKE